MGADTLASPGKNRRSGSAIFSRQNREYVYKPSLPVNVIYEMREWLNYILILGVRNILDLCIMMSCLRSRGLNGSEPSFPRHTYQLGSWSVKIGNIMHRHLLTYMTTRAFYALLRMQSCRDAVWFLAQAKDRVGHKIIRSITVFRPPVTTVFG
jgi:hypothetical protein